MDDEVKPIFVKIPMKELKWVSWEDNQVHITYNDGRTERYDSKLVLLTNESKKSEVE